MRLKDVVHNFYESYKPLKLLIIYNYNLRVVFNSEKMNEETSKISNNNSALSITPFSINDILNNKSSSSLYSSEKQDEDFQEKALDMSKANKTCKGNISFLFLISSYKVKAFFIKKIYEKKIY